MHSHTQNDIDQFGANRTAWIISYTPVHKEPRVIRQAQALKNSGWTVIVFGYGGNTPCPKWWNHIDLQKETINESPSFLQRPIQRGIQYMGLIASKWGVISAIRTFGARLYYNNLPYLKKNKLAIQNFSKSNPSLRPDLILCHDYLTADIGLSLSKKFNSKISIDCHEYATNQFIHDPHWVRWHQAGVNLLQKSYFPRMDGITTVCDGIAELLNKEYNLKRPVQVVRSTPSYSAQPFRPVKDRVKVLYHGEIYAARGLHFAVRSLHLWNQQYELILRGYSDPDYVDSLWKIARETGVEDRLKIEPPVPFDQIIPKANEADIGYFIHEDTGPQRRFTLPNKFFEYVMAGLAVCISNLPEMARLTKQYDLGVLVNSCDEEVIAATINNLGIEEINAFKLASHNAAQKLNWNFEQHSMLSLYKELVQ